MTAIAAWLAATALAVTAYSTKEQIEAAKDAKKARERQAAEQKKKDDIEKVRSVRQAIAQAQLDIGARVNAAALAGSSTSSGAAGGIAGTQADLAGNIAFANQSYELNERIGAAGLEAAAAGTRGQIAGAYGTLGATIFSGAGGFKSFGVKG